MTQAGTLCTYSLQPRTATDVPVIGSTGSIGVSPNFSSCPWTATATQSFVIITNGNNGTGNGIVSYTINPNSTNFGRNATIIIGTAGIGTPAVFTINQLADVACRFTVSPTLRTILDKAATDTFTVTSTLGNCLRTAGSDVPWMTVTSGASGTGNGIIGYSIQANNTPAVRTGHIIVMNATFTVTQSGAICDFAINPANANVPGGAFSGNIIVTTACSWTAVPSASWISITSGATSTAGNGNASYSIGSNPTGVPRGGTIKIATQTFSLMQAGAPCTLTLAPTGNSVSGTSSSGRFTVAGSTTNCTWKATSNAPWITIIGISSENGSGAVNFAVESNPTVSPRSGVISVGTESITIAQAGSVPAITAGGVVNAASFKAGAVAAGEIVTIYGTFIGSTPLTTMQLNADNTGITNSLGATRVLFDGVPSPIVYSSATQTSAIVPYSVAGKTNARMIVEYLGANSNEVTLNVAAASPAIFALDSSGAGPGAVLNQDFSVNSAAHPAARNTIIQIFATGEGATDPTGIDGKLAAVPLPVPVQAVSVRIGGIDAPVVYYGGAPGLVAGLIQINARVPRTAPVGAAVPIVVRVGTIDSPAGITIAVE